RIELPEIDFRVVCSKGTYIRSLANDYGKALNSGAHLAVLRRTKIGDFDVLNAISPEEFEKQMKNHGEN
ncbi:MAG: tRNA pseudouridine(55) synthase, partial [Flavobacterium sp.]|nr:tRNA pseudouridine(55) synthase [Flavobacterium sp.]